MKIHQWVFWVGFAFVLGTGCATMPPGKSSVAEEQFAKGNALGLAGKYGDAVAAFQEAVRLKPDYADAWYNLGVAFLQPPGQQYDEAIAAFRKTVELRPDHYEAWYLMGVAWESRGQYEEAVEPYRQAIRSNPAYVEAYQGLAVALARNCRYPEALDALKKYMALAGNIPEQQEFYQAAPTLAKALEIESAPKPSRRGVTPIRWTGSMAWKTWEEGLAVARKENKPILLYVYADWCPHCRETAQNFGKDKELVRLSKQFVLISQDRDRNPAWLRENFCRYVKAIPLFFFLKSDGAFLPEITNGSEHPYNYSPQDPSALKLNMRKVLESTAR